jgi:YidC/Oxa1 family membrane protein insertase
VVLFGPGHRYAAQSGFIGQGLPNHRTAYRSAQTEVALKPGQDSVEVRLEATARRRQGHQDIPLQALQLPVRGEAGNREPVVLRAACARLFSAGARWQIPADQLHGEHLHRSCGLPEQDKFKKVDFGDIDKGKTPYARTTQDGWVAMIQHYFVAAIIPPEKTQRENYTRKLAEDYYAVGVIEPIGEVPPGGKAIASATIYAGPQEQSILKATAPGLDLVVDYGLLTIIAAPLFWVLEVFHRWTGNWGLAIILLTVMIKLIFFPLSAASYRSMARMKLVAPRLTKIRETYADDRMKQNQAMMELYKTEKINPLAAACPSRCRYRCLSRCTGYCSRRWSCAMRRFTAGSPIFPWPTRGTCCRRS